MANLLQESLSESISVSPNRAEQSDINTFDLKKEHGRVSRHIETMRHDREDFRFKNLLKVCVKSKDLHQGIRIHDELLRCGLLENNLSLATALINMYAKCGDLAKAQKLLEEIPEPNVVAWNALISGCLQHGGSQKAICCFKRMQIQCLFPNIVTLTCILKACGIAKDIGNGKRIHGDILNRQFLGNDIVLGNALVDMYAKCGMLSKAQQVIDELPIRTIVSWSSVIAGYTHAGEGHKALNCFERMQSEGLSPDAIILTSILKACGLTESIDKGKQIHDEIIGRGLLKKDVALGNALVDMYGKCGMLEKAQKVFAELPTRDTISWNALISGYARQGQVHEALECLEKMQREGFSPDAVTLVLVSKACGNSGAIDKGKQIHDTIVKRDLLKSNAVLGTALIDMYVKCGLLSKARELFEEIPTRNLVTWNTLLSGLVQHGQDYEALNCFQEMQNEGLSPNLTTFTWIVKACGNTQAIDKGKYIHDEIINRGLFPEQDISLATSLVDMYAKHGLLEKSKEMAKALSFRNIVFWNALIAGYTNAGRGFEALEFFDKMQNEGLSPSIATFTYVLRACGMEGAIKQGIKIHKEIQTRGFLEKDIVLGNALVDMYAKCGMLSNARKVLKDLHLRDVVSWTILIKSYAEHERGQEAFDCYDQMRREGVFPNTVTFTCILNACGGTGAIDKGIQIHEEIVGLGLLEKDIALGTALVDMYAKCGALVKAEQVLEELPIRNVVSWSAIMAGYSHQGQGHSALICLQRMQGEGFSPDEVAYLSVLTACSHSGLLWHAQCLFGDMTETHGISPKIEHLTCVMVVLGSAGHFEEALAVIQDMPSVENHAVWLALLGACRKRGNMMLGILAFNRAIQTNTNFDG